MSKKREDAKFLIRLMAKISGKRAVLWGPSIVGFDKCYYKYESGREGEMGVIGFSPRKANITVYLVDGTSKYSQLLSKLGPHTTGKVCLYIKRLSDVNLDILEELITASYQHVASHRLNVPRAV